MTLMQRRRALMGGRGSGILWSLDAPVAHSGKATYMSTFNLFDHNEDWTVFVNLDCTNRDCVPIFNTVTTPPTGVFNDNIISTVLADGGLCVSKGRHGGIYGTYCVLNSSKYSFSSSTYPWTYTGNIKICVVHSANSKQMDFFVKYTNVNYVKKSLTYTTYPTGTYNMGAYFSGKLNELTVYKGAKSEAECVAMIS